MESPHHKTQQQVIKLYRDYRSSPPSLRTLIRRNTGYYLLRIGVAALAIMLAYRLEQPELGFLVLGLLLGAMLRDIGLFMRLTKTWPITASVLDWERIEAMLNAQPGQKQ